MINQRQGSSCYIMMSKASRERQIESREDVNQKTTFQKLSDLNGILWLDE